jgi:hypothetical protein
VNKACVSPFLGDLVVILRFWHCNGHGRGGGGGDDDTFCLSVFLLFLFLVAVQVRLVWFNERCVSFDFFHGFFVDFSNVMVDQRNFLKIIGESSKEEKKEQMKMIMLFKKWLKMIKMIKNDEKWLNCD